MGTYDLYRSRMNVYSTPLDYATPINNYFEDDEMNIINNTFTSSPSYMNVPIAGTNIDVRLLRGEDIDNQHIKRLMFRPMTVVLEGSIAVINSDNWLVSKFSKHPYFPTAEILECNEFMRWNTSSGTLKQYPCVYSTNPRQVMLHSDREMLTTMYETRLSVTYNTDTETILEGLRLVLGGRTYWIVGVDRVSHVYDGNGYIIFTIQTTTSHPNDDLVNKTADNSAYYLKQQNSAGGGFKY